MSHIKPFYYRTLILTFCLAMISSVIAQGPKVYIRGGVKTHGPNEHDHPRFLNEWTQLLSQRGLEVDGGMEFPSKEQLADTDVLIIYAADGMNIINQDRMHFEEYLQRGGGVVVIHDGVVSGNENEWCKDVIGGSWIWEDQRTKWLHGENGIYFINDEHPITRDLSNFDWKDEIYYDLDMADDVNVLATSFHSVFIIAPQIWTYEKKWKGAEETYRAFVSLPGHYYDVFNTPHYRAILMRGIAWSAKMENVDALCTPEELASLTYPEGGPTHPDQAAEQLEVHPDFNIELIASEPQISNVLSLDWAPDGSLWVAESPEYPNGRTINPNDDPVYPERTIDPSRYQGQKVDRPAYDRISWLEDSDGDGRYDKRHIFADYQHGVRGGLELVTSMLHYKDGVIVAQAPDILWLRDTDGDRQCDTVETLYTGFGHFDTHAVINNFRWGLDGWIYSAIGYSAGSPVSGTNGQEFGRVTAGIIRFKPDGSALEQVASGSCNTWGFDFAPNGEMFFTTATCGQHFLHVVVPEKFLARGNVGGVRAFNVVPDHQNVNPAVKHERPAYVQIDWVGSFTAAAGCCIYNGGAWPDSYNGSHFVSETTVSLLHHELLQPKGVTYSASREEGREETEFLRGTDLWFRPVHQRVGPDGALYLVDFYNQAAIHNDTRGPDHGARNAATRPDRDHKFARLYRIQHKQAKVLDIPDLSKGGPEAWVKALHHVNGWTRDTAARLLRESNAVNQSDALEGIARNRQAASTARLAALHTLEALGSLNNGILLAALQDPDPVLRRTSLRIAAERDNEGIVPESERVRARLEDPDARSRLNALVALSTFDLSTDNALEVVGVWPKLNDEWSQSAALAVANQNETLFMRAILEAGTFPAHAPLSGHVARMIAQTQDAGEVAAFIEMLASYTSTQPQLIVPALNSISTVLRESVRPVWSPALSRALARLATGGPVNLVNATLPIIARWDEDRELADIVRPALSRLKGNLRNANQSGTDTVVTARTLLGMRGYDPDIIEVVGGLLSSPLDLNFKADLIQSLGSVPDPSVAEQILEHFTAFPLELQNLAFSQLIQRTEWTRLLLDRLENETIALHTLGPANIHRLKTHSHEPTARRALALLETLRGPEIQEKDRLIETFAKAVEEPGDIERGKLLFTQNCGVCHKFDGEGTDLAPDLTGMGAHGPKDLLVHILDPNRYVEPNFISTTVDTKDDQVIDGIVVAENRNVLTLRNLAGVFEIRKDNIVSRRSTGISIMPSGYEALGVEGLRDLIGYLCSSEQDYRVIDLSQAFTADSSRGIYASREAERETLQFKQFGLIHVEEIPFDIVHPVKSVTGNNVLVLKGGNGFAKSLPQSVKIDVGLAAKRIHILGGVGGWAWPYGGEAAKNVPVSKMILQFADGTKKEMIFRNGVEFADYNSRADTEGSMKVDNLVNRGQVRWFSVDVGHDSTIDSLVLESFDNQVAPTFVALTAELY